ANCTIYPHVTIRERSQIGNRVTIQPGAVIGSCGYGYTMDAKGHHNKLEQIGNVIIEDDVEIGANTTIDRARFKSTRIGRGTKLDNLVQIGHNVSLGEDNLIISQSGIAGSAKTGRHVFMGGQGGIVGHVDITDNVQIATRGGVSKDIKTSGIYGGGPVMPMKEFNTMQVHIRKLSSYAKRLKELEIQLASLISKK
ncbi:MAG TPA: UDP-3-O-(3-hydroxymyristoyl)glucosamine N-acyltransferase, partial [Chlamydiales bacterium]|nr:UDP-3-O-(3-hydroxymyristoyl)glucosamine N-acyltransferase [Chlamydiales bacterium]